MLKFVMQSAKSFASGARSLSELLPLVENSFGYLIRHTVLSKLLLLRFLLSTHCVSNAQSSSWVTF